MTRDSGDSLQFALRKTNGRMSTFQDVQGFLVCLFCFVFTDDQEQIRTTKKRKEKDMMMINSVGLWQNVDLKVTYCAQFPNKMA